MSNCPGRCEPYVRRLGSCLVRPNGEALWFTCVDHKDAWASRIHGRYIVLERDEWEARGAGYRGRELGGLD
jgi:hypothetical protein